MPYKFKVVYRPGKINIADALSRLVPSQSIYQSEHEKIVEDYVYFVAKQVIPVAIKPREVEEASRIDSELISVRSCLESSKWDESLECMPYYHIRNELCTLGYLVLRGSRIVIPKALRQKCLDLAHKVI